MPWPTRHGLNYLPPESVPTNAPLQLFSVIIPARDEQDSLPETVLGIYQAFRQAGIPHEIVVIDDASTDETWNVLQTLVATVPTLVPRKNNNLNGFGRAVISGLDQSKGDAVVIVMADASDDPFDAIKYWQLLNQGFDCVFGSRFITGGKVVDYPG